MTDVSQLYGYKELCQAVSARGLEPSSWRTFLDWIEKGLIDRSDHRGAGKGRGSVTGRWSWYQMRLLCLILEKRKELDVADARLPMGALANIPVWLWLTEGETYAPIRQVRRALSTWADAFMTARSRARLAPEATKLARMVMDDSAHQYSIVGMAQALEDLSWYSKKYGEGSLETASADTDLRAQARLVIDPENVGRRFGAPGADFGPETLSIGILNLDWGIEQVRHDRQLDSKQANPGRFHFTDQDYGLARAHWHPSRGEYELMRPLLAAHGPAELYERLTVERMVNEACRTLITLLAFTDSRNPHLPRNQARSESTGRSLLTSKSTGDSLKP